MSKQTQIFLVVLALFAVLVGVSKYVLIPRYIASIEEKTAVLPSPSSSSTVVEATPSLSMGDAVKANTAVSLAAQLSNREKIALLLALPVSVPVSTSAASLATLQAMKPGFVTLINPAFSSVSLSATTTASASGKMLATTAQAQIAQLISEKNTSPVLFGFSTDGQKIELCSLDSQCLNALKELEVPIVVTALSASSSAALSPSSVSTSSASAVVINSTTATAKKLFYQGATVLALDRKTSLKQIENLISQLSQLVETDSQFRQLISGKVLQVLSLKQNLSYKQTLGK